MKSLTMMAGCAALSLLAAGKAQAWVTTNVSTSAELIGAIAKINGESDAWRSTIILAPGSYDVSSSHMQGVNDDGTLIADTFAHIAPRRMTIKGSTDDPRDTVIYGNYGNDRVVYGYNATLAHLTISNGYARSSGSMIKHGGGAYSQNGNFTNVIFTCNHADGEGGGAYNGHFRRCKFIGNSSGGHGGGCAGYKGSNYFCGFMYGCEVRGNYSAYNGGGTSGNYCEDCQIVGNSVKYHGGGDQNGELHRCVIASNATCTASACGGGCYNSAIHDCDVMHNVAAMRGGGVCQGSSYDSRINFNLVTNSTGTVYGGGCDRGLVVGGEISGNAIAGGSDSATRYGGGAFATVCSNCVIKNNFVCNGLGGATVQGTLCGCVISNNVAQSEGTGQPSIRQVTRCVENCDIYESSLDVEGYMSNCRIMNYTNGNVIAKGDNAYTNGWFKGAKNLSLYRLCATNCLFAGNRLMSGGCLFNFNNHDRNSELINCTIADNRADTTMSQVKDGYRFDVVNCIFSGNVSSAGACNDLMYGADAARTKFDQCLYGNSLPSVALAFEAEGMIQNGNARFFRERKPSDPYAIRCSSPARNRGKVADWMLTATDVRRGLKYPRLREGKVDLGCYQCWDDPSGMALIFR